MTLDDVRKILQYQRGQEGSNEYESIQDAIIEFELFLVGLASGKFEKLGLKDFLIFTLGMDRIPIFGLSKPLEVFFVDNDRLPRASTCGMYVEIPRRKTQEKLVYGLSNCAGFGLL